MVESFHREDLLPILVVTYLIDKPCAGTHFFSCASHDGDYYLQRVPK